jgi:hypothetical protein
MRLSRFVMASTLVVLAGCNSQVQNPPVADVAQEQGAPTAYSFEDMTAGQAPFMFSSARTGQGPEGRWVIQEDPSAPSVKQVLAQLDPDATSYRFPIAVADRPILKDLRLSVKTKPVSGRVDQAAGLVFRYQDANNYYVTRANPLESNIRLYRVVNGDRQEFASWSGPVTAGVWHDYRVDALGDRLDVYWDGQRVLGVNDATFSTAGKIGVWTKADSVTYFDDLMAAPLAPKQ